MRKKINAEKTNKEYLLSESYKRSVMTESRIRYV